MIRKIAKMFLAVGFACSVSLWVAAAQEAPASSATKETTHHHNWFVGTIDSVDKDAGTVVVKAADGTKHTFKYTGDTSVKGIEDAAKATDLATKKGTKVAIHYTGKGADKTADSIEDAGKYVAGDEKKPAQK
ncbi:MAG TPA: hypothetical protein VI455_13610 [Terriglobia bacterium]